MTQCPSMVTFGFDPFNCEKKELFKDKIFLIIWACVGYQHLRSQYFDGQVKRLTSYIHLQKPKTYSEFKIYIYKARMACYGTRLIKSTFYFSSHILDDDFWMQIWRYLKKYVNENNIQLSLFEDDELRIRTPNGHFKA